jgi:ketosteroid isomerase-like protein
MNNIEVIQELYRAFREKDYDAFLRISTHDLEWIQSKGFPGGATYKGASEVIESVFKANHNNWEDFAYNIEQFLNASNSVIVIGSYTGINRISGKSMSAAAAHIYELRDGKVCRFRMFADTKTIWDTMSQ